MNEVDGMQQEVYSKDRRLFKDWIQIQSLLPHVLA